MKANFRMEIDALNALVDEQKRTNELLEKLLASSKDQEDTKTQPSTGRGKRGPRRSVANSG